MRNVAILVKALEIIEENLKRPMKVNDLAEECYFSCSGLQKLFGYVFCCSVNDYITKRRMTCASKALLTTNKSVMDISFDYQYGSPEAFSRAFKRFWGISPNDFRKTRRFPELFPKFKLEIDNGGFIMQKRKPVDISDLYDELKKVRGSHVLCIDIIHFDQVNKCYGCSTGDIVIAEAFARLESEITGNMMLFRIGGDEFAIVTGYSDLSDAELLAKRITSHNGKVVKSGDQEIPLSLRVGISLLLEEGLNYHKTLDIMYKSIEKSRQADNNIAIYV